MRRTLIALIAFCFVAVDARVSFGSTEVLDDVDLRGINSASFTCDGGCRVYSPTKNANIVVVDNTGKELISLAMLSNLQNGQVFELEPKIAIYKLKNKGAADPSFVFYIVENKGSNYDTPVVYLPSNVKMSLNAESHARITVLTDSNAVKFESFNGDFTNALPSVYATGIDGVTTSTCRPVFTARSHEMVLNSYFTIYGPIATIDFGIVGPGRSVLVSDALYSTAPVGKAGSNVYVSPGYVGCGTTGTALYSHISPLITSIDGAFTVSDPDGLSVSVTGDYSIEKEADALTLTIGNDVQKLFGNQSISQVYTGTSLKIGVAWTKGSGESDRFALQIDTTMKG